MVEWDAIVVGAGLAGCVAARELAERGKNKVLLLEKRDHIGGNCYDFVDEAGVLVHESGPHAFHTRVRRVYDYLSRFTEWVPYEHHVVARVRGLTLPVPFNLNSLEIAFGEEAVVLEKKLIERFGFGAKVPILELRKSDDVDLIKVADYVYHNIFLGYTVKQWGKSPEDIDPSVTGRVPVVISRDDRYFEDEFQCMPKSGYTLMMRKVVDHPGVHLRLGLDAREVLNFAGEEVLFEGKPFSGVCVLTGQIDQLAGYCFGRLPYRSLDFRFETFNLDYYQEWAQVNFTVDEEFTRITEFKRMTGQTLPGRTTIVKEFSREFEDDSQVPSYPVANAGSRSTYEKYRNFYGRFSRVYLVGRLAEFKYYNMDQIVLSSLTLCDQLLDPQ